MAANRVYIIGMGMGNPDMLTKRALDALAESELIVGSRRMVDALDFYDVPKTATTDPGKIVELLHLTDARAASVVMSGDVGFYSGAARLYDWLYGLNVEAIPGISSLQYLCARLQTSWQDACVVSAHGRTHNVAGKVQAHAKTFVLAGGAATPEALCAELAERGLGDVRVHVGERLSYDDEHIVSGSAAELAKMCFDGLSVLLVENEHPLRGDMLPQLPDDAFVRGEVPMTKEEVRELAVCKLRVRPSDVVWDVGAGTGSVTVELARAAFEGQVFANERAPQALALIAQNKERFGLPNIEVVAGEAPGMLQGLPVPDKVFVGGSAGRLEEILAAAVAANPSVRVCVTAVTLETLSELLACVRELGLCHADIVQVSVARARLLGGHHLMGANNPVYLMSADGPACGEGLGQATGEGRP